jgi:hypothetical protein
MITFYVTQRGAHTFRDYLQDWAGDLKLILKIRLYENFLQWPAAEQGTYIFSDLERLTDEQLAIMRDHAEQLQRQFPDARILNHPQMAMRRLDLLNALHARGINAFRAFPVKALPSDMRYPLFLRIEREHQGPASRLVADANQLKIEALKLSVAGVRLDEVLAVEYCETRSADDWYRKYSAFRIGPHIFPAHIIFSRHWVAKDGAAETDALLQEEADFMQTHPHGPWLRQVFDLANLQYGRIDYSMLNGQPQIWEINTNPILLKSRAEYEQTAPRELPVKDRLAQVFGDCFTSIEVKTTASPTTGPREIFLRRFVDLIDYRPL